MTLWRTPSPEPAVVDDAGTRVPADDLVPLSHLALDMPEPDVGWAAYLGVRAMKFVPDDLGRDCVTRHDARFLLDEQRQHELRRRKLLAVQEAEFIAADREWRESLPHGVPEHRIPLGVTPAAALLAQAKSEVPRRRSLVDDFWNRETPNAIPQVSDPPLKVVVSNGRDCSGTVGG